MSKRKSSYCNYNNEDYCNSVANQYLVLVSIFSVLLSQEIEDDEDLGILGTFLIALGEELSLASELRIACKSKFEEEVPFAEEVIFDRGKNQKYKKVKKIKRKYIKKDNTKNKL